MTEPDDLSGSLAALMARTYRRTHDQPPASVSAFRLWAQTENDAHGWTGSILALVSKEVRPAQIEHARFRGQSFQVAIQLAAAVCGCGIPSEPVDDSLPLFRGGN